MPRARKPKPQPLYTFTFRDHQRRICIAEVWQNFCDCGGRGVHNGRLFDTLFDAALEEFCDWMFFTRDQKVQREAWRLFTGPLSRQAREHIQQVARRKGLIAKEALTRRVAIEVRRSIQAAINGKPSLRKENPNRMGTKAP
jgi:hypothetical protein